jgi:hypothetical protein
LALALLVGTVSAMIGCAQDDTESLSGPWDGTASEWGQVHLKGNEGTYTDTYGPGPGTLAFRKVGPRAYEGTWKETETHGGTLSFQVSEDGHTIEGKYTTAKTSPRRPGYEGKVLWSRKK